MKTYICTHCESSNVYRKRIAYWCDESQSWIDETFADELCCADCNSTDVEARSMIESRDQLVEAMDAEKQVRWMHSGYICYRSKYGEYLKTCIHNDHTIGIFHRDGVGMNVKPQDCYILEESK